MKKLLFLTLTLISSIAMASELNVPNQFEDGQVTSAAQMNANFDAIQAAVNDNHARIESMQQPTKAVFQGFSTDSMDGGQGLLPCNRPVITLFQAVIFVIQRNLQNLLTMLMQQQLWQIRTHGHLIEAIGIGYGYSADASGLQTGTTKPIQQWLMAIASNNIYGAAINPEGKVERADAE